SRTTWPSSSSSCAMTLMSPVSTSISTSASSAARGNRLYAVTSAFASASSMISSEMPLSTAIAVRASIISLFLAMVAGLLQAARPRPAGAAFAGLRTPSGARGRAPLEDRAARDDVGVRNPRRNAGGRVLQGQLDAVGVGGGERAAIAHGLTVAEVLHRNERTDGRVEVLGPPQRAL